MKEVITFFIVFIIVYLLYLFLVILNKKRMNKYKDNNYVTFLVNKYNLDRDKLPIKKVANMISLANSFCKFLLFVSNSFIISFTFAIVMMIDNIILKMFLALAIIIPLMLFMYHLIGKNLQKTYKKIKK